VQPYAVNISAALQSAQLSPDTSQNLTGVYTSPNAAAYPISAYSYILVQCAPNAARATCNSPYTNPGISATLNQFMSYVACAGQIHMAAIGYAPLPPQLSQFLADAVGYMTNQPAQQLNASNCSNPTFSGSLGAGASPPPLPPIGNAPGASAATAAGKGSSSHAGTSAAGATGGTGSGTASGAAGTSSAQSQEASNIKTAAPAALGGGQLPTSPLLPLLALLVLLAAPVVVLSVKRKRETP
jgi:phosphate transport system substrate-binding protein